MTYTTLKSIASDQRMTRYANAALSYPALHGSSLSSCLHSLADWLGDNYPVNTRVTENALIVTASFARAHQPACMVVSLNFGQKNSPSAEYVHAGAFALVQVFDAGADDGDVEGDGAGATDWVETEGRLLWC